MRVPNAATGIAAFVAVAFALAGPPPRARANYLFVSYQHPNAGPFGTSAEDINNQGVVTGNYDINDGNSTVWAFIQTGNSFTNFPGPQSFAGSSADAYRINSAGYVVGDYLDAATTDFRGYLRNPNGSYTLIDHPGAATSEAAFSVLTAARGINDAGTIVGRYDDPGGVLHGFFLKNGVYSTYDVPGATATALWFINNKGQFGGDYSTADGLIHGLIVSGSTITTVDYPGATDTNIRDMNDNGIAVGYAVVGGVDHGFLYDLNSGRITPFDVPGATDTDLFGINDAGVIAGTYNGFSVAVLAIPIPEPSSLALLALGTVGVGAWRRWKKRRQRAV